MNDYLMLNDLFKNEQDSIGFQLFKKSNIIELKNSNNNNYSNKQIEFNTLSISDRMINYSNAYIELELSISVDYDNSDNNSKDSIPKLINLKSSFEIVKSLRIMLNNTIISNEYDINRSNLVNYILNNGKFYPISHGNMNKASETLSIVNNQFITNKNYSSEEARKHELTFKIPIYLKDVSNFFKNIGLINFGRFNINISLIDDILSTARTYSYEIKNAYLVVEEIQLGNDDSIKYLKMLNNGYERKINITENNVKIFKDEKMNGINEKFPINVDPNSDSVFIYGIDKNRKTGLQHDLPSVGFENASINISNVRFENLINNDISAYEILKNKSNHPNDFLITYNEFKTYYRIYCFNINRETHENKSDKHMTIITNISNKALTIYVVWKNYSTITMNYSKNGLSVYKSY